MIAKKTGVRGKSIENVTARIGLDDFCSVTGRKRERERLHTEIPIFQKETRRRRRRRESLFIAPVLSRAGLNYSAGTRVGGSVREFPSDVFLDDFIN